MIRKALFTLLLVLFSVQAGAADFKSTRQDQESIAVTIYNSSLGLVKDVRRLTLEQGIYDLKFMDVASGINPVTVHIKSLTSPEKLAVLEQNYEYDLLNPKKLLDKYLGREVKLLDRNEFSGEEKLFKAELLSNNQGPIYRIDGEIHINHPGRVILPEIPENLIAKPTLVWMLKNEEKKEQMIEASYLTSGINWQADYVLILNKKNDQADLNSWVTINNQSGATYENSRVKLVAGDVNRVREERNILHKSGMDIMETSSGGFREEAFFEYHLYSLDRLTTIKDRQTKQVELLSTANVPVKERMIYYGAPHYFRNQSTGQMQSKQKVGVFLDLENRKEHNLGMPLPAGVIRAYREDTSGSLQFIGEDRIDHTPKNEKITIKMGDAFDVAAERVQTDYKILHKNAYQRFDSEQEWKITLRNHKDHPVEVEVVEPFSGEWEIVNSNFNFDKVDANTAKFLIKIGKQASATLVYRARIRYY